AVLARLGAKLGDTVRLGDTSVRLAAVLEREPDRLGGFFSIGPRVIVSDATLHAANLLQPGAMVRYEYRVVLPPGADPARVAAGLKAAKAEAGWRVQASGDVQPQVAQLTDRLATFLTLAGLSALAIGGLGVALAVQTHLGRRTAGIATLKCLGATSGQILAVYLAQILLLAAVGSALGLVLGAGLLLLLRAIAAPLVPVPLDIALSPASLLIAAAAGLLTASTFALRPLLQARAVPPAALFRSLVAPADRRPRLADLALVLLSAAALSALAIASVPGHKAALWFVLGIVLLLALLTVLARLVIVGLAGLRPGLAVAPRLALANLRAAGGGAVAVVVALGAGLAVLTTTALVQASLSREVGQRLPGRVPAYVFIDIQPNERDGFTAALRSVPGATLLQELPNLRARVVAIAGKPAAEAHVAPNVQWTLNRDRGLTYEAAPPQGVRPVAGSWWPPDYQGPPLVSIDDETAQGYGVHVGDTLTFNVLGRPIEARIANIRPEIDWSSGRIDFLFVMSPGLLAAAPHTLVAAVDVPPEREDALVGAVADAAPNVTPIPVREAVEEVARSVRKIGLAVDAVAGVTLLAGILVLAAGVAAVRDRHRYQAVILKAIGATRPLLTQAFLLEYGALGLASALTGVATGTLASWLLVTRLMRLEWAFAPLPVAGVAGAAIVLSLAAGAFGLRRTLGQPVAPALRGA
ncbi:MAG TPA: FtsX-like permease family protein, partial [Candidatus Dormibacteraeota bacterium]